MLIGIAEHVDDGKTSRFKTYAGVDADLSKKRGLRSGSFLLRKEFASGEAAGLQTR